MEKDSADKATTELENSVTSEEKDSLADKKEENSTNSSAEITAETEEEPAKKVEEITSEEEVIEEPETSTETTEDIKEEELVQAEPVAESDTSTETAVEPEVIPESGLDNKETEETTEPTVDTSEEKAEEAVIEEPETSTETTEENKEEEITKAEPVVESNPSTETVVEPEPASDSSPDTKEIEKTTEPVVDSTEDKVEEVKKTEEDKEEEKPKSESGKTSEVPEAVLSEQAEVLKEEVHHHDEFEGVDFSKHTKEELVEVIKKLGKDDNPYKADKILKVIAPLFNKLRADEKAAALEKFIAEGGVIDDFQFKPDEFSLRFDANYKLIKDKKSQKFREQEVSRTKNLVLAEQILEELRAFMDSEESNASFTEFKTIQQKWKDLGDVPSQHSRTLWANYNALIHRFYDQRSIYFELKELDRKKNYEAKIKLCEKAESLEKLENLREAIRGLNDLHHEFKHMGPVPKEVQEELWQRFKAASDKVYERRKIFVNDLKAELHENQVKKEDLVNKIKVYIDFNSDKIKEWNEKTKDVLALQKEWETIGGLPKDKAKVINKEFWGSFKKFFGNKHQFFKKLDADRDINLVKKQELVEKAKEHKDSEDWDKTANELKRLQSQWRDIGPVPEKFRKKLYEEFKAACDEFFENRRKGLKSSQDQYKENLKKKKELIAEIQKITKKADDNLDKFNELRKSFSEAGYVPKKNIGSIKEEYHLAIEKFLNELTVLNVKEKTEISLESEFSNLANSEHSQSELYQKEQSVRRQISKFEDDIALWENNLEFFARSKSTDKLRDEVNKKIDDASVQLDGLKRQLKMLRSL